MGYVVFWQFNLFCSVHLASLWYHSATFVQPKWHILLLLLLLYCSLTMSPVYIKQNTNYLGDHTFSDTLMCLLRLVCMHTSPSTKSISLEMTFFHLLAYWLLSSHKCQAYLRKVKYKWSTEYFIWYLVTSLWVMYLKLQLKTDLLFIEKAYFRPPTHVLQISNSIFFLHI